MHSDRFSNWKSFQKSFFLFFLILSFLTPGYHNHDYIAIHHGESEHSFDLETADKVIGKGLSNGSKQFGPHLHLKKEFTGSSASHEPEKKAKQVSFVYPAALAFNCGESEDSYPDFERIKPKGNFLKTVSGLSPPANSA